MCYYALLVEWSKFGRNREFLEVEQKQYIVKEAAGVFWLIDTAQSGVPYHEPLQINEIGADIFYMWNDNKSKEEIIDNMCAEYDAPRDVIEQDVQEFLANLEQFMAGRVQTS